MVLEIHDEILFDFPRGAAPEANRNKAMILKWIMEQSGDNLVPRIPTPVSCEYVTESWGEGIPV
jgi:DNA polymerase I-like protein with 3'-5' exonuclease and polymerase domains